MEEDKYAKTSGNKSMDKRALQLVKGIKSFKPLLGKAPEAVSAELSFGKVE